MAASPNRIRGSISDIGETELIRRFFERQPAAEIQHHTGIGDDCAVLAYSGQTKLLVTTDQLVEDVHFVKEAASPGDVGYKAVAVNFSDIAAMGGRPTAMFLSLALPGTTPLAWLEGFRKGLFELCDSYKVSLLGGDTTGSKRDIFINIMVLGQVHAGSIKLRSGARDGDRLCVTDTLGDSAAGLRLLTNTGESNLKAEHRLFLLGRHLRPRPALEEGEWLAEESGVHAMMDLSDGLAADATRIAERSNIGINIDLNRIPTSDAFRALLKEEGDDIWDLTVNGGEDYHLLCTVAEDRFEEIARRFRQKFKKPLYAVGRVTAQHSEIRYLQKGKQVRFSGSGFDHFKRIQNND